MGLSPFDPSQEKNDMSEFTTQYGQAAAQGYQSGWQEDWYNGMLTFSFRIMSTLNDAEE